MLVRRVSQAAGVALTIVACSSAPLVNSASGAGGAGTGGVGTGGSGSVVGVGGAGGSAVDAGTDAGDDGGALDAAMPDASAPLVSAPAIACADTIPNVYVPPAGLPTMTPATRGDVVRCAPDTDLTLPDVVNEVVGKGIMTPMKTAVNLFRIAYRTQRGNGSPGISSARVYLPTQAAALPLPVIVVGHPTDGIAASCAPSTDPTSNEDLALPWAGLGYVVIVPDYAGLGTPGVQGYMDNRDQAYSILDGARALRKLLPAAALSPQVLAVGWSQGGGAVLSAQAMEPTYGAGGTLAGVVVFAPEWPSRLNSFGYVDELNNPTELTIETGISEDVVTVMSTYAYFANYVGTTAAGEGFPAASQAGIDNAVSTLCQTPLGGYLQANEPHVGDIFDPTFRSAMLACIDGGDAGASCVDPASSYYTFLNHNILAANPDGPPLLFVQGLADVIMPPASEAACNIAKLMADGVTPQVCVDAEAQHTNVVGRNMDFAIPWALALLGGQPLPTCSAAGMPACTP